MVRCNAVHWCECICSGAVTAADQNSTWFLALGVAELPHDQDLDDENAGDAAGVGDNDDGGDDDGCGASGHGDDDDNGGGDNYHHRVDHAGPGDDDIMP